MRSAARKIVLWVWEWEARPMRPVMFPNAHSDRPHGDLHTKRSNMSARLAVWASIAWLALVIARPGFAAPLYEVDLQATANSGGVYDSSLPFLSDSNPVSLAELRQVDMTTGFASAAAGPGSVAVIGISSYTVTDPTKDTDATGVATAISTIDDVIFTGAGPLNNIFLNLNLSGLMDVSGTADVAGSTLEISVKLNNGPGPHGLLGYRTVQIPSFFFDDGELDGVWPAGQSAFSGTIAVGPFDNVPTGVPVSLRIGMTIITGAVIFAPGPSGGESASGIGNLTLSFTSCGELFAGVPGTVNSAQGNIVNNQWIGSPVTASPLAPAPTTIPAPGFQPSGLAYDGCGLYVSELSGLRRIFRLDPTTGAVLDSFLAPSPNGFDGGGNPSDLVADGAGRLFVSDIGVFGAGIVYEIDTAGTMIFNSFPLPFRGGAIAFDAANQILYIGDLDTGAIRVTDRFGGFIKTFDSHLRPAGMVFDPSSGHLWVIDIFDSQISKITTDGELVLSFAGPRNPGTQGLGGVTLVGSTLYISEVSDPDPFNLPEIDGTIFMTSILTPVASAQAATGAGPVTFSTSDGFFLGLTPIQEGSLPQAGKPQGVTFPFGFFNWTITGLTLGQTVTVTIAYPSAVPSPAQYWKVINGTWTNVAALLGDDDGDNVLTLTIMDGGPGDADGSVNGQISDPGGVSTFAPAASVAVDIKPRRINPDSTGVIPVAILTTATFDATTVDPRTVLFGATGTEATPVRSALAGANMILHFRTRDTGIGCGATAASLTGKTFSGEAIEGSDSIETVGCKKKGGQEKTPRGPR